MMTPAFAKSPRTETHSAPRPCRGRACTALLALVLLVMLGGCSSLSYYWQAAAGQWEILRARRPIGEVLDDARVSPRIKAQLRTVREAQAFGASALALPEEVHYTTFADLERTEVSWLVVSAREFGLRAREECFLFVGCFGYRGFFARDDADAYAAELAGERFDVLVRPVTAYSTLGWFDDPLLNTMLREDIAIMAGTVFHEQAHRVVFAEGDTNFNESFATFVETEGVARFLAGRNPGGAALLRRYQTRESDRERFLAILRRGRKQLEALYGSGAPPAEMRQEKARLFDEMRRDYQNQRESFTILNYERWFLRPLNNAHLVGVGQYHDRIQAFRALLDREQGDFARFMESARTLSQMEPSERAAAMDDLEAKSRTSSQRTPLSEASDGTGN